MLSSSSQSWQTTQIVGDRLNRSFRRTERTTTHESPLQRVFHLHSRITRVRFSIRRNPSVTNSRISYGFPTALSLLCENFPQFFNPLFTDTFFHSILLTYRRTRAREGHRVGIKIVEILYSGLRQEICRDLYTELAAANFPLNIKDDAR